MQLHFTIPRSCSVTGCANSHWAKGFCVPHYGRWRYHGDPLAGHLPGSATTEERFWHKVDIKGPNECWVWNGAVDGSGYGSFGHKKPFQRGYLAHRYAYEKLRAPIPEGLQIDHLCRNRGCVNPAHLEIVTQRENMNRGMAHRISIGACKRGHEFSSKNTHLNPQGYRVCRVCDRQRYMLRISPLSRR